MQRLTRSLLSLSFLGAFPFAAAAATPADQCTALAAKFIGNAKVTKAEVVTSGTFQEGGTALTGLPPFCHVRGTAKASPRSNIGFAVWLPLTNWNGRIQMVGNGGYGGQMNYGQLATLLKAGSVAAATDAGHVGPSTDFSFGKDNDEAVADWGYRSVHETIVPTKAMVTTFYGKPADKTYFLGCSTGGHQGLVEAVKYPDDFDGILAGAPANNRTNLNLSFLWRFVVVHPQGDNTRTIMTPDDLKKANTAAMAQCDAQDGVRDGVIVNPPACKFDVKKMVCTGPQSSNCLSEEHAEVMNKIYEPLKRKDTGEEIYVGWPVGSEWVDGSGGWHNYWHDAENPQQPMRAGYFRDWAYNDPSWDWWKFDFAKDVDFVRKRMGDIGAHMLETDLSAFKKRGGKIILYHGWADHIVSGLDTVKYFEKVQKDNTGAGGFTRLFMVPGMGHCSGGPGATNFTFDMTSDMTSDADSDAVLALQRWVEEGQAPERIVSTRYRDGTRESGVALTRPLCAWPKVASYSGNGATDDAANFVCK